VSTLGELLEALRQVEERLEEARGQVVHGQTALTEARAALSGLDPNHPETTVPPGLYRAHDQIERTRTLIENTLEAVQGFATRL
jgi:hypothetical protein